MNTNELLRIDPALRVAMAIAEQSGVPKEIVTGWYAELILDNITLEHFLLSIGSHVTDPGLRQQFESVRTSLPLVGSNPTQGTSVAGAPIVSEK